jgi:hypothetical protein
LKVKHWGERKKTKRKEGSDFSEAQSKGRGNLGKGEPREGGTSGRENLGKGEPQEMLHAGIQVVVRHLPLST